MSWTLVAVLVAILALASALLASAAPWVPTWRKDLNRILTLAEVKPGCLFYDLGCGDGRLVLKAAEAGAQAVGVEFSAFPYIAALARTRGSGAKIKFGDFFRQDLRDADAVYFFLTPPAMPRLALKLGEELRPGALAVSYHFPLPGWTPETVSREPGRPTIYVYRKV